MNNIRDTLDDAEKRWKAGDDVGMRAAMAKLMVCEGWNEPDLVLRSGSFALNSKQFLYAIRIFQSALKTFPEDVRFAEVLVDAYFQMGDADGALEAYAIALARGLPAQTEAVRRVTRVALFCGRLDELELLLGDPSSAPFQAECHAMLNQEKVAFGLLEARRERELGISAPSARDVRKATQDGDLPYASHLYLCAARSLTISEVQLLEVVYESFPPSGAVSAILGFISWRLLRRFPENALAKLEVAMNGLLQFGDAQGAKLMLEEALIDADFSTFPGSADRMVRLATSCSVFGTLTERQLVEICGRHWFLLRQPNYTILSHAFAARSALTVVKEVFPSNQNQPRVAVCISGQLRNYLLSWATINRAIQPLNAKVFVSTWDNIGAGLGTGDSIARRLPPFVSNRLALSFQTREFFSTRYPNSFSLFQEADTINLDQCRMTFNTQYVRVHQESEFESRLSGFSGLVNGGSLNQAKMYFGIHDAISLMQEWEVENSEKFDVVIRLRPDLTIQGVEPNDIAIASSRRVALSTHLRLGAVGDIFLIMARDVADVLHAMWPSILAARSFAVVPGASGAAAETALFENLCWNGVKVLQLRGSHALALNSLVIPPESLWKLLKIDLKLRSNDEVDLCVASAISEAAGHGVIGSMQKLEGLAL